MKKILALVAITLSVAATGFAHAHGDKPKHGGLVQESSNDVSFELVAKGGKAMLYVEEHGKPVSTASATGKLTVLNGSEKSEMALEPSGDNALVTKGDVKLAAGSKAIALVTFADKKSASVRFAVK